MTKKNSQPEPVPGHGAVRTCVGCRRRAGQSELVRVRVAESGEPVVGDRGPGRGAWVCPDPGCVQAGARARAFSRALRSGLADRNFAGTLLAWLGARDQ